MRFILTVLLPLILFGLSGSAWASGPSVRFDKLSIEHGLSQSMVFSIAQDEQGFMWFGTQDGLNRYDGYEFKTFRHDPDDPNSLSKNFVWALHNDSKGRLWVGSEWGGVDPLRAHQPNFPPFSP